MFFFLSDLHLNTLSKTEMKTTQIHRPWDSVSSCDLFFITIYVCAVWVGGAIIVYIVSVLGGGCACTDQKRVSDIWSWSCGNVSLLMWCWELNSGLLQDQQGPLSHLFSSQLEILKAQHVLIFYYFWNSECQIECLPWALTLRIQDFKCYSQT